MQNHKTKIVFLSFLLLLVTIKCGKSKNTAYFIIVCEKMEKVFTFNSKKYTSILVDLGCFYHIVEMYMNVVGSTLGALHLTKDSRLRELNFPTYEITYNHVIWQCWIEDLKKSCIKNKINGFEEELLKIRFKMDEIIYWSSNNCVDLYFKLEHDLIRTLDEILKLINFNDEIKYVAKNNIEMLLNFVFLTQSDNVQTYFLQHKPDNKKATSENEETNTYYPYRKFHYTFDALFISFLHDYSSYNDTTLFKKVVSIDTEAILRELNHFFNYFDDTLSAICINANLNRDEYIECYIDFSQIKIQLFIRLWLSSNKIIYKEISKLIEQWVLTLQDHFSKKRDVPIKFVLRITRDTNIIDLAKWGIIKSDCIYNFNNIFLDAVLKGNISHKKYYEKSCVSEICKFHSEFFYDFLDYIVKNRCKIQENIKVLQQILRNHKSFLDINCIQKNDLVSIMSTLDAFYAKIDFFEALLDPSNYKRQVDTMMQLQKKIKNQNLNKAQLGTKTCFCKEKNRTATGINESLKEKGINESITKQQSSLKSFFERKKALRTINKNFNSTSLEDDSRKGTKSEAELQADILKAEKFADEEKDAAKNVGADDDYQSLFSNQKEGCTKYRFTIFDI